MNIGIEQLCVFVVNVAEYHWYRCKIWLSKNTQTCLCALLSEVVLVLGVNLYKLHICRLFPGSRQMQSDPMDRKHY